MTRLHSIAAALLVAAQLLLAGAAVAHEGHDDDAPPPLNLPVAPRVVAVTPDYELGVLSGEHRLTIFLHRFETGEPVKDAKVFVSDGEQEVEAAQRMADGSLFVPKATQHLLSVRTVLTAETKAPRTVELSGTIIADPNSFGRVQAGHAGRIEAPDDGLAFVGKRACARAICSRSCNTTSRLTIRATCKARSPSSRSASSCRRPNWPDTSRPASSVVRAASGLSIVWVKSEAERFEPHTVRYEPLDGQRVVVLAGLKPDQSVVTEGATLLNQIR
jgi:hypothetical protein